MSAIDIPAERVAPVAQKIAKRAKDMSAFVMAGWTISFAAGIALLAGNLSNLWSYRYDYDSPPDDSAGGALKLVVLAWLVGLGVLANWFVRRGRRADAVAALATSNQGLKFAVDDDKLITIDGANILPPLTLSLSRSSRDELLAPPTARVILPG